MEFLTKIENKEIVEFSDFERMKNYQNNLMIIILFNPPRYPAGQKNQRLIHKLHNEANRIESWLKSNFK